jgi:hypothetical protein
MLVEDLTQVPPPFQITNPLTKEDFPSRATDKRNANDSESNNPENTFLTDLEYMQNILAKGGHHKNTTLNAEQWIRMAAQLIVAMHHGIQHIHNRYNKMDFLEPKGPDDGDATHQFANASVALAAFFTNPTSEHPTYWQQCAHCLMVSSKLVKSDEFQAQLVTYDQNVASARASILNTLVNNLNHNFLL